MRVARFGLNTMKYFLVLKGEIEIGDKFGYWTVLEKKAATKTRDDYLTRCVCGKEKICKRRDLIKGTTKSCGCMAPKLAYENKYKNGFKLKLVGHSEGYLRTFDPNSKLADKQGYVFVHRQIMQDELLKLKDFSKFHVHHIDGNKKNNQKDNLMIVTVEEHRRLEEGWKKTGDKWFKTCKKCKKEFEVNNNSFYQRKSGRFLSLCKKCC